MEATAATTSANLRAFHGDPAIKARYQARLEQHHKLDQFIRGGYTEGDLEDGSFRGCAVGCTIHSDDHAAYEKELGISRDLVWLEDEIFEGVPVDDAPQFAVDFLEAIPVGADLSLVVLHFLHWLLIDEQNGVIRFANTDEVAAAIRTVGDLLSRFLSGEAITSEQWQNARDAAHAHITDDYYSANTVSAADTATAAAADAADYAANADYAPDAPTYAARTAADDNNADDQIYQASRARQAAKLLQLLREAPIPK